MNPGKVMISAVAAALTLFASAATADQEYGAKSPMIKYTPPLRGAPSSRVGGGTRGLGDMPRLAVLAPDHTGLTTRAQPTLFWYVSKPMPIHFQLRIVDGESLDPIAIKDLDAPEAAGIHGLPLSETGVELKPGVTYRWSVKLATDGASRPRVVMASGTIERVAASPQLTAKLAASDAAAAAEIYADSGIWYDALASISAQIQAKPSDRQLHEARAQLLEQVGLREAAASDRDSN